MPPFTVFEASLGNMKEDQAVGLARKNKKEEHKYRSARKESMQDQVFAVKDRSEPHILKTVFKGKEKELDITNSDKMGEEDTLEVDNNGKKEETASVFNDKANIEEKTLVVAFKDKEEQIFGKPNGTEETLKIACKDNTMPSPFVSSTFPYNIEAPSFTPRPAPTPLPGLVYYNLAGPLHPSTFLPIYQPGLHPNLQLEQANMHLMSGHLQPLYMPPNSSPGHYLSKPQPSLPPLFPVPPPSPPHLQAWQHHQVTLSRKGGGGGGGTARPY